MAEQPKGYNQRTPEAQRSTGYNQRTPEAQRSTGYNQRTPESQRHTGPRRDQGRRQYPRVVPGTNYEAFSAEEESIVRQYGEANAAGDELTARLAQAELAGYQNARSGNAPTRAFRAIVGGVSNVVGAEQAAYQIGAWINDAGGQVGSSPEMRAAFARGVANGLAADNPSLRGLSEVVPSIVLGLRVAGSLARRFPAIFAARGGQRVQNVLRAAALGGATEGAVGVVREGGQAASGQQDIGQAAGDVLLSAALGSVIAGGFDAAGAAGAPTVRGIARYFGFDPRGARVITERVASEGRGAAAPAAPAAAQAQRVTGEVPSAGATIAPEQVRAAQRILRRPGASGAAAAVREGAVEEAQRLPARATTAVRNATGGAPPTSPAQLAERARDYGNQTMQLIGDDVVPVTTQELEVLLTPTFRPYISAAPRITVVPGQQTQINESMDQMLIRLLEESQGQGGVVDVPLRVIEDLRTGLNNASRTDAPGAIGADLRALEDAVDQIGRRNPDYADYRDTYTALRQTQGNPSSDSGGRPATGFAGGREVLTSEPAQFAAGRAAETPAAQQGREAGAVSALSQAMSRSPESAGRTAAQIIGTGNVAQNVRTALPNAVNDVIEGAGVIERQAQNLANLQRTGTAADQDASELAVGLPASLGGGAGYKANVLHQLIDSVALPPGYANRVADALINNDPAAAARYIQELDQAGVDLTRWNEFITPLAPGLAAGGAASARTGETQLDLDRGAYLEQEPVAPAPSATQRVLDDYTARANAAFQAGKLDEAEELLNQYDQVVIQSGINSTADTSRFQSMEDYENAISAAMSVGSLDDAERLVDEYERSGLYRPSQAGGGF